MSHLLKEYRGKVDLIYIDPPFDSKADYKKKIKVKGKEVSSDSLAFEEKQYGDIWTNDEYLQFMYERLILCKELLSDTGSIYVHCDWHKSAYLKCVLDSIFGQDNFRNEIIWCYKTSLRCSDKSFGRDHDNILFYSKTNYSRIHPDKTNFPVSESTIKRWSAYADENGFVSNKHFAGSNSTIMNTENETKGFNINNGIPRDWWEISSNVSKGNTNEVFAGKYPTQKPEALLERIIKASSNDGELDGRMVKIMPVNRIATKADLKELIANLPYKTFEQRKEENPSDPVERITLVCMGHEPDLKASLQMEVGGFKLDVEIVDILRDKADLQLKREAEAIIIRDGDKLVIKEFYPMNLMQKLSLQKEYVEDWKQLVESVMVDFNYDGAVLSPSIIDIPDKNDFVIGEYSIPETADNIRVKITDLLSESLEVEVK